MLHIFLLNCSSDAEDDYLIGNLNTMIDLKNSQGLTPLMIAIYKVFNNFCQKILDKNADVSWEDSQGLNAKHHAVLSENTGLIKNLYKLKKYPFLKKNKDRILVSEFAVKNQKIQAIKTLFELSDVEIDCQKLGEEILKTKNPQIMRIIMQSRYGDKLFKDFSPTSDKFFGKMAKLDDDGLTISPINKSKNFPQLIKKHLKKN